MSKKNLPNIPIYIGDWERDCNVLSLESEAAWLRIIFKLWNKGKQSTYKVPTKSLQNLWRCSKEKMQEILDELTSNDIAEINVNDGFVAFTCRRFVKENELSNVRKGAVSKRKDRTKQQQTTYKTPTNNLQITEIENEIESEYENKDESENKKEAVIFPFETKVFKQQWEQWKIYKAKEFRFKYKSLQSEQAALAKLNKLASDENQAIAIIHQSMENGWKGFFELKQNNGQTNNTTGIYSEDFKKRVAGGLVPQDD